MAKKKPATRRKAKVTKNTKAKVTKKKPARKKSPTVNISGSRVNGLPAKQWAFCLEYIIDLEAKAAAERAGYSKKTCEQIGWQLLQKPDVKQCIEQLLEDRARRCGVHADRVVWELASIGFSDITDFLTFTEAGITLKVSTKLTEKARRAISEIRETINSQGLVSTSFKLHSKVEALKTLAQHLGMTKQQVDHNITGEGEAKVLFFPSNGREVTEGDK